MRICLLVEGSYPYVIGGLAAWIQMLIKGMPEHEFIVYSIGAEKALRGKFKYELPANLVEIHELFMDEILDMKHPATQAGLKLSQEQQAELLNLLCSNANIDLLALLSIFRKPGNRVTFLEIFMSFEFFDLLRQAYKLKYSYLPFTDYFWTIRSMLLPLFFLLQQELPQADVYHSVATGYCGVVGATAAYIYAKPFILTEHGIYSREREEEIIKSSWAKGDFKLVWIQYFYSLAKLSYDKADKVITLFEKNAEIEVSLGCKREKIQIVPNGICLDTYGQQPVQAGAEGVITIAAILRVVPVKDVITMIRSFYLVKNSLPKARFWIMGSYEEEPQYYKQCQKLIETLQLEDIIFLGAVEITEYLPQVDILVLSSISEGQPLAVLEAMAAAKPCVCTDVGCCRELLYGSPGDTSGQAGIVVPVMDFYEMSEAIISIANNQNKRLEFAKNGQARVRSFYTYDKMIAEYQKIYTDVVSEVSK